jgi:hypothetical protein
MSKYKIVDLLSERHRRHSPLQKLLHQATEQEAWTAELQALVPEALRAHCRVTDIRGARAIVVCHNAACATRMRFLAPKLLEKLKQLTDFRAVEEIQVRVSDK